MVGKYPGFEGYGQQDSQELLLFLVDGLHEDTNRVSIRTDVYLIATLGSLTGSIISFSCRVIVDNSSAFPLAQGVGGGGAFLFKIYW